MEFNQTNYTTVDIFERIHENAGGPIGQYQKLSHGYYSFPKLEGEIGPRMMFRGREVLNWSLNNYLGLANNPEVRKADAEAAAEFGMAYPMGARMMSGQTKWHEQLERELAAFVGKPDAFLLNYGYQGMISIIDSLLTRRDVVVYDSEAHACIIDGLRLHTGKRFVYPHNDMEACRKQLGHATKLAEENGGGVLVITEGVFGMKGEVPPAGRRRARVRNDGEDRRRNARAFRRDRRRGRTVQYVRQVDGRDRRFRFV